MNARSFQQSDDCTLVPITFDPYGSFLVVFDQRISRKAQGRAISNDTELETVKTVKGPWKVTFDPQWGAPAETSFSVLTDWTHHPDEGIRNYSGEASYIGSFEFEPENETRYWIQLNRVKDVGIATILLNSRPLGTTWTPPFRIEITGALQSGTNLLEIQVVNSWLNRLIGDRGKSQEERFTRTNIKIREDWDYRESGLLGPVEILESRIHPDNGR
jgi:hypothetical protein